MISAPPSRPLPYQWSPSPWVLIRRRDRRTLAGGGERLEHRAGSAARPRACRSRGSRRRRRPGRRSTRRGLRSAGSRPTSRPPTCCDAAGEDRLVAERRRRAFPHRRFRPRPRSRPADRINGAPCTVRRLRWTTGSWQEWIAAGTDADRRARRTRSRRARRRLLALRRRSRRPSRCVAVAAALLPDGVAIERLAMLLARARARTCSPTCRARARAGCCCSATSTP